MESIKINYNTKPLLKTKGFSELHIDIFNQLLISEKSIQALNLEYGYTKRSHALIDHSRKVMYKLLIMENLSKSAYMGRVIYPRKYRFWWKELFDKHKKYLPSKAIKAEYYMRYS